MTVLFFVLYLLALVCFLLATKQAVAAKLNLLPLGLAFTVAVPLIQMLQKL